MNLYLIGGNVFGRAERLITCGGFIQIVTVVWLCPEQRTVTFEGEASTEMCSCHPEPRVRSEGVCLGMSAVLRMAFDILGPPGACGCAVRD